MPARRQAFIGDLLLSANPKHKEIARLLMDSALNGGRWVASGADFSFGARKRGTGWQPKNRKEILDWYLGFISLLETMLKSDEPERRNWAKEVIAAHFRNLWSQAYCFDALEQIVREYAKGGVWPEIWTAIKQTICFDGEMYDGRLLPYLKELERYSAPVGLYSEIEAYAFGTIFDHIDILALSGDAFQAAFNAFEEKIAKLGEMVAAGPENLWRLNEKIWRSNGDAVWYFGQGLARGNSDPKAMFEMLINMADKYEGTFFNPSILRGFLAEIHSRQPKLFRSMLKNISQEPKLKRYYVDLLCSAPIDAWGVKKLIELAQSGEMEAARFQQIIYGGRSKTINDKVLAEILKNLIELEGGVDAVFEILNMRLISQGKAYSPSESLLAIGRKAIRRKLAAGNGERRSFEFSSVNRVVELCLAPTAPKDKISEIMTLVCRSMEPFYFINPGMRFLISTLLKNFPEIFLDTIFNSDENEENRIRALFRENSFSALSLNAVPMSRLIAWCEGDQDKIQKIAKGIYAYGIPQTPETSPENRRQLALSGHIKAMLDIAEDKCGIIKTIFENIRPAGWSDSLADILEERSHALEELLNCPEEAVRNFAKIQLETLSKDIRSIRAGEEKEHREAEQTFE